jgi:hypothetical protein
LGRPVRLLGRGSLRISQPGGDDRPRRTLPRIFGAATLLILGLVLAAPVAMAAGPRIEVTSVSGAERADRPPTVHWDTGDGRPGEVRVSSPGKPGSDVVAVNSAGSAEVPWVRAGEVYDFRLYRADASHELLATTRVEAKGRSTGPRIRPASEGFDLVEVFQLATILGLAALAAVGVVRYAGSARRDRSGPQPGP